ncbi:pirin family protein [Amycolatopsis sp. H20-H5]|uniref:pirin family protein n=1 Tax=Amycolatopsis sp. H20-H5 TaxID=3046309 RepID=UPI002DB75280|nr:pirin family protein [Amycolatopsis sp. H20-H5]MEC3978512.1 pirin family protein [Amycolatopsis sp. H20-H5]
MVFVDHYGPDNIAERPWMAVPPHPHLGLQTVSWLLDGEVLHRDSLGSEHTLRPGQLGLMTAGRAISHSEQSPPDHAPSLHGAQLWVALPDGSRATEPQFEFHGDLPLIEEPGLRARVILGEFAGLVSPGRTFSPLAGVDVGLTAGADTVLPLEPDFEYAVLTAAGVAEVDGVELAPGSLLYLGCGRTELRVGAATDARMLLLGGEPFAEKIVMWWNFVARTGEEIAAAREQWRHGTGFGTVRGYEGDALAAPPLPPGPLAARGRTR